jgi:hypothetical protein
MSFTYGYDLKDGDKILEAPVQTNEFLSPLLVPGATLVNHLPFCTITRFIPAIPPASDIHPSLVRHIPSWVPYFSYQPFARIVQKLSQRMRNEPFDFAKNALVCGGHTPSILRQLIPDAIERWHGSAVIDVGASAGVGEIGWLRT